MPTVYQSFMHASLDTYGYTWNKRNKNKPGREGRVRTEDGIMVQSRVGKKKWLKGGWNWGVFTIGVKGEEVLNGREHEGYD